MKKRKCKFCKSELNKNAKVCHKCGNPQNWFMYILNSFNYAATFVSIIFLVVAINQWIEARKDRISAEEALKKADIVTQQAKILEEKIDSIKTYIDTTGFITYK